LEGEASHGSTAGGVFSLLNETWSLDAQRWVGKTMRTTVDLAQQQWFVTLKDAKEEEVTWKSYCVLWPFVLQNWWSQLTVNALFR
jgi:hypothetical protein